MALYNCKVPVIIKKKKNFTLCPGKLRENLINIFPGFSRTNKQNSRTLKEFPEQQKKSRTFQNFSRMWQPCNPNPKLYPNSNPSFTQTLILISNQNLTQTLMMLF